MIYDKNKGDKMKKKILLLGALLSIATSLSAEYVSGYTKSNGTYVSGYNRSSANYTKSDNYSTKGNVNPYTGEAGTKSYNNYNNSGYGSSLNSGFGSSSNSNRKNETGLNY